MASFLSDSIADLVVERVRANTRLAIASMIISALKATSAIFSVVPELVHFFISIIIPYLSSPKSSDDRGRLLRNCVLYMFYKIIFEINACAIGHLLFY